MAHHDEIALVGIARSGEILCAADSEQNPVRGDAGGGAMDVAIATLAATLEEDAAPEDQISNPTGRRLPASAFGDAAGAFSEGIEQAFCALVAERTGIHGEPRSARTADNEGEEHKRTAAPEEQGDAPSNPGICACDHVALLITLPGGMSQGKNTNLWVRLGTTVVLGPLLLSLLFWGPVWGWSLLIALSAAQASFELVAMSHPGERPSQLWGAVSAFLIAGSLSFGGEDPRIFLTTLLGVTMVSALLPLARLGDIKTSALRILGGIGGPLYLGLFLGTLALLRSELGDRGPFAVFLTLTIAWMGDTGGYTFGRLWGKTPLYPAVSPKKTREGLLGSVVFASLSSLGASLSYFPELSVPSAILLGVMGALLGQSGDLVESLIKRSFGVKDSGSILPGHGGLLDRIDALLVVSPLVYVHSLWMH